MRNQIKHLKQAIVIAGSQSALARLINVFPSQLNHWLHGLKPIPLKHCISIERATGISKLLLCSDYDRDLIASFT